MRINKTAIFYVAAVIAILLLLYSFVSFDYISNTVIEPKVTQELDIAGNIGQFSFVTKSKKISGIVVGFRKNFYILDSAGKIIEITLAFTDRNGKLQQRKILMPIDKIKHGNQKIFFSSIEVRTGEEFTVTFKALSDLYSKNSLFLLNQDYSPDPEINTATRIIYHESLKDLINQILARIDQDHRFAKYYFFIILLNLTALISLIVFSWDKKDT